MKTLIKYSTVLLLFTLSISSCEKKFTPKLEGSEYKAVVNSLLNSSEDMRVSITKSIQLNERIEVLDLQDAEVAIFENGNFIENMSYSKRTDDVLGFFRANFIPKTETKYRIEVAALGLDKVNATAKIPEGANITNAEVKFKLGNSYQVNFQFDDPSEKNYYFLKMFFRGYKTDSITGEKIFVQEQRIQIPEESVPKAQQYIDNGYIFKDDTYKGTTVNFSGIAKSGRIPKNIGLGLLEAPEEDDGIEIDSTIFFIRLETLSEDAYKFYSSHAIALKTDIDFFSEAASIYGNVENGFGIFAGVYVSEIGVEVEE